MKQLIALALAMIALCLSGCMKTKTLVAVKKDGSGAIQLTMLMSKEAQEQMKALAPDKKELFSEEEVKTKAAGFGEGVAFVSYEKAADGDYSGYKAVFSFTDVTKLKLEAAETPAGGTPGQEKRDIIHFEFAKGDKSKLTVIMDANKPKDIPAMDADQEKRMLEEMKQMFKGMKAEFAIQVEGKPETTAGVVDGETVTLISVEFDKLLASDENIKLLQLRDKDPKGATEKLNKIDGVKLVGEEKFDITF